MKPLKEQSDTQQTHTNKFSYKFEAFFIENFDWNMEINIGK